MYRWVWLAARDRPSDQMGSDKHKQLHQFLPYGQKSSERQQSGRSSYKKRVAE